MRASVTTAAGSDLAEDEEIAPECKFFTYAMNASGPLFERFVDGIIQQQSSSSSLY